MDSAAGNAAAAVVEEAGLLAAFKLLSIEAVVFAALSTLFGAYFVLFVFAVWSTYRQSGNSQVRQRIVTVALFVVLSLHWTMRAVVFSQDRVYNGPKKQPLGGPIPLIFIASMSTTTAGLLADGMLAWRLYVVYGRTRSALYLPAAAVVLTALLGYASDLQDLAAYHNMAAFVTHYERTAFEVNAAWGWAMFATNTALTGAVVARVLYVTRRAQRENAVKARTGAYAVFLEAVVESALVTWIGLLLYGVATVAPEGHITTDKNVGFVMICIIPIFFGISQCLITVRLGILDRPTSTYTGGSMNSGGTSRRGVFVEVQRATRADSQTDSYLHEKHDALTTSEQGSVTHIA
ncbi:hypothetical protein PsYK624_024640 [Phanerochaete sordida]|uniref:Uncharacterized protein n=1 Tax=Phanerochaete sordida TaxID=48140 RepID=A0A9P3G1X8_9APHY|nr:hypothetical protein PsYK624_024640 [Phanerochaete sordida]